MKCTNPNLNIDCWMDTENPDCSGCSYKNAKGLTDKITQAKQDNPDAICFVGSNCPNLDPNFIPKGPCAKYHGRWPTSHCRVRWKLDGTVSVKAQEWMKNNATKTDEGKPKT